MYLACYHEALREPAYAVVSLLLLTLLTNLLNNNCFSFRVQVGVWTKAVIYIMDQEGPTKFWPQGPLAG